MIGNRGRRCKHAVPVDLSKRFSIRRRVLPSCLCREPHQTTGRFTFPAKRGRSANGIKPSRRTSWKLKERMRRGPRISGIRAWTPISDVLPGKGRQAENIVGVPKRDGWYKMLTDSNIPFQFRLWDSNPDVVSSVYGSYRDCPDIVVTRGDGYVGLQSLESACLALIDPISVQDDKTSIWLPCTFTFC